MLLFCADRAWRDLRDYTNWRHQRDTGDWRDTGYWRKPSDWRYDRWIHRLVQPHYQQLLSNQRNRRALLFSASGHNVLLVVYAVLLSAIVSSLPKSHGYVVHILVVLHIPESWMVHRNGLVLDQMFCIHPCDVMLL